MTVSLLGSQRERVSRWRKWSVGWSDRKIKGVKPKRGQHQALGDL